ncbi:MAG: hypothetical protein KUG51_04710 [Urechidicola sp.]|nr:hypothetical protein [Urechidicola sp.]
MNVLENPITKIGHLIPQKFPFVMVDTLLSFSKSDITSSFTIKKDNLFFLNDKLSEPGLIENMAQTVALHTGYDFFLRGEEAPTGYIGSIKKIEIKKLPKFQETITTHVVILQEFLGITLVEIEVYNSDKELIASGQMKTVIANNG